MVITQNSQNLCITKQNKNKRGLQYYVTRL